MALYLSKYIEGSYHFATISMLILCCEAMPSTCRFSGTSVRSGLGSLYSRRETLSHLHTSQFISNFPENIELWIYVLLFAAVLKLYSMYPGNFSIILSPVDLILLKLYGELSFLVISLPTVSFSYVNIPRSVLLLFTFVWCSVSHVLTSNLPLPTETTRGTDLRAWMSFTSQRINVTIK